MKYLLPHIPRHIWIKRRRERNLPDFSVEVQYRTIARRFRNERSLRDGIVNIPRKSMFHAPNYEKFP